MKKLVYYQIKNKKKINCYFIFLIGFNLSINLNSKFSLFLQLILIKLQIVLLYLI
jgi:hypothetical protein